MTEHLPIVFALAGAGVVAIVAIATAANESYVRGEEAAVDAITAQRSFDIDEFDRKGIQQLHGGAQ